jgi:NAD(P)-dependent dehydrogenase (short-subunit alcohol dehydrogenase family)
MDTGLKGRTVLITGASRNIGRLAALAFAKEGANLALCTSAKMDRLEEVAAEARKLGAKVVAEKCDVADAASVQRFVEKTVKELSTVHVAINNAVDRGAEGKFLDQDDESWQRNLAVNLTGPRNICRLVLPLMMKQKWGRIINLSGISAHVGGSVSKGMVKLGIIGFSRGLAREFATYGITANCVTPGGIDVERDAFQTDKPLKDHQPIRRKGRPEEIVHAMLYLASEDAAFTTGQSLHVNGGMYFL